jgi:glycosyltransferase involved in cell wall biosynthesis
MNDDDPKRLKSMRVSLSTGGDDLSYALGLSLSLSRRGIRIDFLGSNSVDAPELHADRNIRFLNLRGDQSEEASILEKIARILQFYARLIAYIVKVQPRVFHILWNNKFEYFDRTFLTALVKMRGHKVVFTAHNINKARRDGNDSFLNRGTLRLQYWLVDHIFVHTEKMAIELYEHYGVPRAKVTVIPFGLNETSPRTEIDREKARRYLGIAAEEKVLLFFGQIAPYKGLEYLIEAAPNLLKKFPVIRIIIAGKVKKGAEEYWSSIRERISRSGIDKSITTHIRFIPDKDVEKYFKATDTLVVPYVDIFQSGVPFLAYSFGVPVIATDVGALSEEIEVGETGFLCESRNSASLDHAISSFFESVLYREQEARRPKIIAWARKTHSWEKVSQMTHEVYEQIIKCGKTR